MTDDVVAKRYPYFNFYPQDWLGDYELGRCSLGAQGLWVAMLCVMHQSEPRGYLIEHGKPMSITGLSRLVRAHHKTVITLVKELEENRVFSRSIDGIIYCRKMVHDTEKRTKLRANGFEGGNPSLKKHNQKDNQGNNQEPNPYGNTNSNSNTNVVTNVTTRNARERAIGSANKFDEFWSAWPNKVGKPVAAKSYAKVAAEHEAIMAGVFRYIENKPPDRSWLNPSTFLNNRRWEDEPAPVFVGDTAKPKRNSAITEAILSLEFEDGQSETNTDSDCSLVQQVPFLIEHEQG